MPVTHGVTGSSPVRTASQESKIRKSSDSQPELGLFCLFEVKQNVAFLRSMSGANSVAFLGLLKNATKMQIFL